MCIVQSQQPDLVRRTPLVTAHTIARQHHARELEPIEVVGHSVAFESSGNGLRVDVMWYWLEEQEGRPRTPLPLAEGAQPPQIDNPRLRTDKLVARLEAHTGLAMQPAARETLLAQEHIELHRQDAYSYTAELSQAQLGQWFGEEVWERYLAGRGADQPDLDSRISAFEELVLTTARLRLLGNHDNLTRWKELVIQAMPDELQAQILATDAEDLFHTAEQDGERLLFENWAGTRNPAMRHVFEQQIHGRFRACMGCHASVQADNWGKRGRQDGPAWTTPADRLTTIADNVRGKQEIEHEDLSAEEVTRIRAFIEGLSPQEDERKPSTTQPGHRGQPIGANTPVLAGRRSRDPAPPGSSATRRVQNAIERIDPILQALGPAGYRVLPESTLSLQASATPAELRGQVLMHIDQRLHDYTTLVEKIEAGDIDYAAFVPVIQDLLPHADADVQVAIQSELERKQIAAAILNALTLGASLALLLLTIFPPTSAIGIAGTAALEVGLGGFLMHRGAGHIATGRDYARGIGAHDVFTKAQQDAAAELVLVGFMDVLFGSLLAISGIANVRGLAGATGKELPATTRPGGLRQIAGGKRTAQQGAFRISIEADGTIVGTSMARPDLLFIVKGGQVRMYELLGDGAGARLVAQRPVMSASPMRPTLPRGGAMAVTTKQPPGSTLPVPRGTTLPATSAVPLALHAPPGVTLAQVARMQRVLGPGVRAKIQLEGSSVRLADELRIAPTKLAEFSDDEIVRLMHMAERPLEATPADIALFESKHRLRFPTRVRRRVQPWLRQVLAEQGISPADPQAAIFRMMTEAEAARLWDIAGTGGIADIRVQATRWALGRKPKDVRELVAYYQIYEAEIGVLRMEIALRIERRIAIAHSRKQAVLGRPLTAVEKEDITRTVTRRVLGKDFPVITGKGFRRMVRQRAIDEMGMNTTTSGGRKSTVGTLRTDAAHAANTKQLVGANTVGRIRVGKLFDQALIKELRNRAGRLNFAGEADASYHAHKHFPEIPADELVPGSGEMLPYLDTARKMIREGDASVRINQDGSRSVEFRHGSGKTIVHVSVDGQVAIATYMPQAQK